MMLMFVGVGFYLGKNSDEIASAIERGEIEGDYTTKQLLDDLLKVKKAKEGKHVVEQKKHLKKPAKESLKTHVTKVKKSAKKIKPPVKKRVNKVTKSSRNIVLPTYNKRPKLAIIIDDVSKQSQMNAIMQTGLKITPSIFPPSELSMTSNHLADRLKHYMIHLPMESGSKQFNSQYKTLLTRFSRKQIEERVKELRRFFPNAHFINNHTGSVFTNDYNAMFRLYTALRKEGFIFMDSRTIGSSKVKRIASKFGDPYVSRDIFIDNIHTVPYIHKQLRKAVNVAKKKGYAIAIGHTHHITMQALSSANDILKDVELIYIDELYKER
ncbi:MAG: divergent polysaccharide deacetylase family protein [Epsilonproteobacteria bacterium]|nr:divergent polysaccharide deacetylase family protein [Campylobacterota bacterium]